MGMKQPTLLATAASSTAEIIHLRMTLLHESEDGGRDCVGTPSNDSTSELSTWIRQAERWKERDPVLGSLGSPCGGCQLLEGEVRRGGTTVTPITFRLERCRCERVG